MVEEEEEDDDGADCQKLMSGKEMYGTSELSNLPTAFHQLKLLLN